MRVNRANSRTVTAAEQKAIQNRTDNQEANLQPKSMPLLYRAVRVLTGTFNALTRSEKRGGSQLVTDVKIAKQAHALFFHNNTYKDSISKLSATDRREFNGLAYSLAKDVENSKLTKENAWTVVAAYLKADRNDGFGFDTINFPSDSDNNDFPNGEQREQFTAYLDMRLSTPAMMAFGVARGDLSEETAIGLMRTYEGIVVTGKVILTAVALAGAVTAAVAAAIAIFGVTVVFAPFVMPAIIGLAVVSGVIFAAYIARGMYEANSQTVIDSMSTAESLLKDTDVEKRATDREQAKAAQTDLTKASEWVVEILFFLKAAKPVAIKANTNR